MRTLSDILKSTGLPAAAGIPLSACRVLRPYLIERLDFVPRSAYFAVLPYYPREYDACPHPNVSVYAASRDYHLAVEAYGSLAAEAALEEYPGAHFAVFGDRSPLAEAEAAARAGLGVLGDNGLLITRAYSSFVFLMEILTDLPPDTEPREPEPCLHCGACAAACPGHGPGGCLSALTQKKGDLTPAEEEAVRGGGLVWGCDRCQTVCPYTAAARRAGTLYTPLPFFTEHVLPVLTEQTVLDAGDFARRAYSWRGTQPLLRNLRLTEAPGRTTQKEQAKEPQ